MVAAEKFVIQQLPCPLNVRTLAIRNGARVRILDEVCDLTQSYVDWLCFGCVLSIYLCVNSFVHTF